MNRLFCLTYILIILEPLWTIKKQNSFFFFKLRVFHLHTRYNNHCLYWLGTNLNQPNFDTGFLKIAWPYIKTGCTFVAPRSCWRWQLSIHFRVHLHLQSAHSFHQLIFFILLPQRGFSVICMHRNATLIIWNCCNGPLRFILLHCSLWSLNTNKIKWNK